MKQVFNPYLPNYEYVPDGEPRVFGDRVYIYGSHDRFKGEDFCLNDYVCYSAPVTDLTDWKYEGVIYHALQDPKNGKGTMHMCAPDCVQGKDGRYYLYYQLHVLTCTSVAVADNPAGPFEFYGYVQHPDGTAWGEKKGDTFAFDPGVLVDDDGKAYCYVGFSPVGFFKKILQMRGNKLESSVCLELAEDMKTVIGEEMPIVPGQKLAVGTPYAGHEFFEASSIRKIGDTYYYVYSSLLSHELCYATSKYPNKDFVYGGTLISIGDLGYKGNTRPLNSLGNTHGGMACLDGQWYIFYHRQTNKQKCCRQGCAEKIYIREDGSIGQAEMTSCGLNQGPLAGHGTYGAYIACTLTAKEGVLNCKDTHVKDKENRYPYFTQTGSDREENPDQYIANMKPGAEAGFKYFAMDGAETISVEVRGDGEGMLEVFAADPDCEDSAGKAEKQIVARIALKPSGNWAIRTGKLTPLQGEKSLTFRYVGKGSIDFNSFTLGENDSCLL